jgi:multiple sugar transport system substrate-binding protein
MRAARILATVLVVCAAAAAAGYWMVSDTVRFYSPSAEAHPLRVSFWGPYEEFEMWKEMLANFRREHPDVSVKMEYFPSRYEQKIQQLLVADDAPDVMLYQDEPFPNITEVDPNTGAQSKFLNLTRYAAEHDPAGQFDPNEFWRTAVEYFGRWEDRGRESRWQQYAIPIWGGCNLFYYNKACFRGAGLRVAELPGPEGLVRAPDGSGWLLDDDKWTLDEFLKVCDLLTVDRDGDGRIDQFGLSLGYSVYWLPLHYACGADILTKDLKRTAFHGPEVEASLRLWQDMIYKYHYSPRAAELGQMGEGVGFFTGRVAMFCSGPWGMPFLNASGVEYDVLHVPRNPTTRTRATRITWDAVAIFANSKKKPQAWMLVKHLTSLASMKVISKVQRSIPARKAAAGFFARYNPKVSVGKFVAAAGTYARKQPITKHWSIMERAWSDAMSELRRENAAKRLTPAEAIGKFYSEHRLMKVLPPSDPDEAERYRRIYRARFGEARPDGKPAR